MIYFDSNLKCAGYISILYRSIEKNQNIYQIPENEYSNCLYNSMHIGSKPQFHSFFFFFIFYFFFIFFMLFIQLFVSLFTYISHVSDDDKKSTLTMKLQTALHNITYAIFFFFSFLFTLRFISPIFFYGNAAILCTLCYKKGCSNYVYDKNRHKYVYQSFDV